MAAAFIAVLLLFGLGAAGLAWGVRRDDSGIRAVATAAGD